MSTPPDRLPRTEELRKNALSRVVRSVLETRSAVLPVAVLFVGIVVGYDPSPLKLGALGFLVVLNFAVIASDRARLRLSAREQPVFSLADLLVIVLLQSTLVLLTGAIESPLLSAYVFAAFAAGISFGWDRRTAIVVLALAAALWVMALGGFLGVLPRTFPAFAGLERGFLRDPYALERAAFMTVFILGGARVGARVQRSVLEIIDAALSARGHALAALEDRNRELVQLSGAIAHELKNPLASIQGLAQLLERGGGNAERRLEVLRREVERMRVTLDEFLNLSRPLGELAFERVSSSRIVAELGALHEGLLEAKSLELVPPAGELRVPGDPRKLQQALTNLLQNAIEATPSGGTIRWVLAAAGGRVLIGFEDPGPGMPAELLARAANVGVTTKPGGSGIGLAVARAIAEQHGGRLVLENQQGGGLRAVLELPSPEGSA